MMCILYHGHAANCRIFYLVSNSKANVVLTLIVSLSFLLLSFLCSSVSLNLSLQNQLRTKARISRGKQFHEVHHYHCTNEITIIWEEFRISREIDGTLKLLILDGAGVQGSLVEMFLLCLSVIT